MQFGNKFNRARQAQRRALGLDDPEIRKARQEEERVKLERGDLFSLLLSAFHMIFLPSVGVLVLLVMAVSLIFGLFSRVLLQRPLCGNALYPGLLPYHHNAYEESCG